MRLDPKKKHQSRQLRRNSTPAEAILWKHLRNRAFADFKFRRQVVMSSYILDFYCAECGLVLELDGDTHLGNEVKDQKRQQWIESRGLKVLRFWNSQIYTNVDDVMKAIWSECNQRRNTFSPIEHAKPSPRVRRFASHVGPLPGGERGTAAHLAITPDKASQAENVLTILFQNSDLLAIDKPPGVAVHDAPGPGTSILRRLREERGLAGLTPVHRLDKDASGVLLFAKSKQVASEVTELWPSAEKTYLALCAGAAPRVSGFIDAPILENQTGKPERLNNALKWFTKNNPGVELPPLPAPKTSAVHPAGRTSQTEYEVEQNFECSGGKFSLLRMRPKQGRMHQIRVHLASIGCPLLLDKLYGNAAAPAGVSLTRMPLHASRLRIQFRGKELTFDAPLPKDIQAAIDALK